MKKNAFLGFSILLFCLFVYLGCQSPAPPSAGTNTDTEESTTASSTPSRPGHLNEIQDGDIIFQTSKSSQSQRTSKVTANNCGTWLSRFPTNLWSSAKPSSNVSNQQTISWTMWGSFQQRRAYLPPISPSSTATCNEWWSTWTIRLSKSRGKTSSPRTTSSFFKLVSRITMVAYP